MPCIAESIVVLIKTQLLLPFEVAKVGDVLNEQLFNNIPVVDILSDQIDNGGSLEFVEIASNESSEFLELIEVDLIPVMHVGLILGSEELLLGYLCPEDRIHHDSNLAGKLLVNHPVLSDRRVLSVDMHTPLQVLFQSLNHLLLNLAKSLFHFLSRRKF